VTLSGLDAALLFGAGVTALGGIGALALARTGRARILPMPGAAGLSAPTAAVIGVTLALVAHQLAAPVFGWWGLKGPMGALLALGVASSIGSVWLDRVDRRHEDGGAEP